MKRIAIIDDEQDARDLLRTMIHSLCPDVEVCGEADGVDSGYVLIRQTQPHGVLLDISMEDGTGFDLLDRFPNHPFQVIFTTAHDAFALKAFRYHAIDYLLKPISPSALAQTIDRVQLHPIEDSSKRMQSLLDSARTGKIDRITLTSLEGMIFLRLDEIIRLESEGSYTTFYTLNNERHLIARPMKDFQELLPEDDFFRPHQSHIVNLSLVRKVLREDGGYALMEGGSKVPIARRRKDEFLAAIRQPNQ